MKPRIEWSLSKAAWMAAFLAPHETPTPPTPVKSGKRWSRMGPSGLQSGRPHPAHRDAASLPTRDRTRPTAAAKLTKIQEPRTARIPRIPLGLGIVGHAPWTGPTGWALSRNDSVGSVVLARSACANPSSFARYGPRTRPRRAHTSDCPSICFAITSLPTGSSPPKPTCHGSEYDPVAPRRRPTLARGHPTFFRGRPTYPGTPDISWRTPDISWRTPEINSGVPEIAPDGPEGSPRTSDLCPRTPNFVRGRPTFARGRPTLVRGRPTLVRGRPTLVRGRPTFVRGRPTFVRGRPTLFRVRRRRIRASRRSFPMRRRVPRRRPRGTQAPPPKCQMDGFYHRSCLRTYIFNAWM